MKKAATIFLIAILSLTLLSSCLTTTLLALAGASDGDFSFLDPFFLGTLFATELLLLDSGPSPPPPEQEVSPYALMPVTDDPETLRYLESGEVGMTQYTSDGLIGAATFCCAESSSFFFMEVVIRNDSGKKIKVAAGQIDIQVRDSEGRWINAGPWNPKSWNSQNRDLGIDSSLLFHDAKIKDGKAGSGVVAIPKNGTGYRLIITLGGERLTYDFEYKERIR